MFLYCHDQTAYIKAVAAFSYTLGTEIHNLLIEWPVSLIQPNFLIKKMSIVLIELWSLIISFTWFNISYQCLSIAQSTIMQCPISIFYCMFTCYFLNKERFNDMLWDPKQLLEVFQFSISSLAYRSFQTVALAISSEFTSSTVLGCSPHC